MILPEDIKGPLPSDEDDFEGDFASLPPSPTTFPSALPPSWHLTYDYPPSPNSTVTQPLLLLGDDDIELGPAPPYTEVDPRPRSSSRRDRKGALRKKIEKRFVLGLVGGVGLWIGIMCMGAIIGWGHGPRVPRRGTFHPPRPGHPEPSPGDNPGGGRPIQCASLPSSGWSPYIAPLGSSDPSDSGLVGGDMEKQSLNTTIFIPLDQGEIFAQMFKGPAAVGAVFLSTYEASSNEVWESMSEERAIVGEDRRGKRPGKGEFVKVVVESIIDVKADIAGPLDSENSPGWEMLSVSNICLSERGNDTAQRPFRRDSEGEQNPHLPPKLYDRGIGVSIATTHPVNPLHEKLQGTPLQFRVYLSLPSFTESAPLVNSFVESISMRPPPPPGFISSLDVHVGNAPIYLGDLRSVTMEQIYLESDFGEIHVEDLRSDTVKIRTTGEITGHISVSNDLSVETPIGPVRLNISLSTPSPHSLVHPAMSPVSPSSNDKSVKERELTGYRKDDPCSLPPVRVDLRAGSEDAVLRYVGWEVPCRGLDMDVRSIVGGVDVHSHPLFQGPFHLVTANGPVNVDLGDPDIPDPEGLGRWRNITLEERGRVGSSFYHGSVYWEKQRERENAESRSEIPSEEISGSGLIKDSPPPYDGPRGRGMHVRTSVGAINVVF
ncbi:hypothetical protein I350_01313 [Cryptococcus amylolentus CBS 6273]|uniref:Adhesin domain-containing protein n=1 Tax=Cryptococcus amylolentus CBS 6273 TaxID=1296118 RepID=A0A1E3KCM2_9TREE|nr:hypothetical protein I350_01313 [Cryptococcus amylolentus CBS 6273]